MTPKLKAILAAVILFPVSLAVAQDRLPTIDAQKFCGVRAKSSEELTGDKTASSRAFETCMRSENEARDALVAAWKDIPQTVRATCIQPNVHSPSYIEWISCLELHIDVKALRTKKP